ncbi:hypothetical protein RhiJN_03428 [Ceratobasidium sp. AG-Ba]|nr:hypothetical protein RhiJN_03428 [Ceratobasidium sp. AG-Ba]
MTNAERTAPDSGSDFNLFFILVPLGVGLLIEILGKPIACILFQLLTRYTKPMTRRDPSIPPSEYHAHPNSSPTPALSVPLPAYTFHSPKQSVRPASRVPQFFTNIF